MTPEADFTLKRNGGQHPGLTPALPGPVTVSSPCAVVVTTGSRGGTGRPWDKPNWSPGRPSLPGFAWSSVDRSPAPGSPDRRHNGTFFRCGADGHGDRVSSRA